MAREECIKLIQKAINLLEASSQWNDRASMLAHRLLVEGEKDLVPSSVELEKS